MSYSRNNLKTLKLLGNANNRLILLNHKYAAPKAHLGIRYFSVVPILTRILRLRYLFLGGAVGGGVAISNVNTKFLKTLIFF
jgi:hypothetical protein